MSDLYKIAELGAELKALQKAEAELRQEIQDLEAQLKDAVRKYKEDAFIQEVAELSENVATIHRDHQDDQKRKTGRQKPNRRFRLTDKDVDVLTAINEAVSDDIDFSTVSKIWYGSDAKEYKRKSYVLVDTLKKRHFLIRNEDDTAWVANWDRIRLFPVVEDKKKRADDK